jgi:hypothetical protein
MSNRIAAHVPILSAPEAHTLGTSLLTAAATEAAKTKKNVLPASIEPSRQRLSTSLDALDIAQTPAEAATDPQAQKHADDVVDNAWGAFNDWLLGWTRVPAENQDAATKLYDMLFTEGLAFLKAKYKTEYAESDARLRALTPDHEALIETLGGTPILQHLRDAHAAYGVALGVTEVQPTPTKTTIRAELDAVRAALRDYVAKVVAYEDPDIEGSAELVAALLAPLLAWHATKKHKAAAPPDPTPPAPVPAPAKS